jgi:hypothetical protein
MKKRSFIKGLTVLSGALLIPIHSAYSDEDSQQRKNQINSQTVLFRRFFIAANGFPPNENQMRWIADYQDEDKHYTRGPRHSGVTTFMLTLALFESKYNKVDIAWLPPNSRIAHICRDRIKQMEDRLYKTDNDGTIFFCSADRARGLSNEPRKVKCFVMADASQKIFEIKDDGRSPYAPNVYSSANTYYFGTVEPSSRYY